MTAGAPPVPDDAWREDDVVEIFGDHPDIGQFMHLVRDRRTGEWLGMRHASDPPVPLEIRGAPPEPPAPPTGGLIAILDTGVLRDHPDLANRVVAEMDFTGEGPEDRCGHGTAVSLIALRQGDFGIVNVKVADAQGRGTPERLIRAMDWLADYQRSHTDRRITANLSLGVYRRRLLGMLPCDGTCDVCRAARRLVAARVFVVAAAGNTAGRTACPATLGVVDPGSGVVAVTLVNGGEAGVGRIALDARDLPVPTPVSAPRPALVTAYAGEEADRYLEQVARQMQQSGDAAGATTALRHLAERGATPAGRMKGALGLGMLLHSLSQDGAAAWLRQAAEAEPAGLPEHAPLLLTAAGQLLRTGALAEAEPLLVRVAASGHPVAAPLAAHWRAKALRARGAREEAKALLHQAIAAPEGPRHAAALTLASILAEEGATAEALPWLDLAAEAPDAGTAARAELALGDVAAASGQPDRARAFHERCRARDVPEISALAQRRLDAAGSQTV